MSKQERLRAKIRDEFTSGGFDALIKGTHDPDTIVEESPDGMEEDTVLSQDTVVNTTTVSPKDTVLPQDTVSPISETDNSNPLITTRYTKVSNSIFDILVQHQTPFEHVVYLRLYRLSYGFNRQTTDLVGYKTLEKACNMSRSTVRRAITGLVDKGHIIRLSLDNTKDDKGSRYRILLPHDMPDIDEYEGPDTVSTQNTVFTQDSVHTEHSVLTGHHTMLSQDTIKESIIKEKKHTHPLSSLVDEFYTRIRQPRIATIKRNKGVGVCEELLKDGFTIENLQTACDWAIRNVPDIRSIGILPDIIGSALSSETSPADVSKDAEEVSEIGYEERVVQRNEAKDIRSEMTEQERNDLYRQAEVRIPDTTRDIVKPDSRAYAMMIDAIELDILVEEHFLSG